jgi:hypothetical protein
MLSDEMLNDITERLAEQNKLHSEEILSDAGYIEAIKRYLPEIIELEKKMNSQEYIFNRF